jgi:cytochrome c oxidase subunit 2
MSSGIETWPAAASPYASQVDTLFWSMTAVTGAVAVGVFIFIIVFSVRYRAAADADRRLDLSPEAKKRNRAIEITCVVVPLVIFLAFFFWAARLYFQYFTPPARTLEVYVVAKQWMWKLEHTDGRCEINELHVPRDQPVKLILTSQDVIHSFFVPALRVKRDVVPGRYTVLWFRATRPGTYHLFCAEYCGTDHSRMKGGIVVMEPEEYANWLSGGAPTATLASQGAEKFRSLGCSGCHSVGGSVRAPLLDGLFGRNVPLASGAFVKVDERYVRDSILQPARDVAAGYDDVMPAFAGNVSEEDLLELVAYIKSLAAQRRPAATEGRDGP